MTTPRPNQDDDVLFRIDDAARRLGVTPKELRGLIRSKRLDHVRHGRGGLRINLRTLNAIAADNRLARSA